LGFKTGLNNRVATPRGFGQDVEVDLDDTE
jgi:hypothetical protein